MSTLRAFESCPRFQSCNANDCPLDPDAALHGGRRSSLPGEEPCRAQRVVRERIASAHGLAAGFPLLSLERERDARRARWRALSPDVRARRAAGLLRGCDASVTGDSQRKPAGRPPGGPEGHRVEDPVASRVESPAIPVPLVVESTPGVA